MKNFLAILFFFTSSSSCNKKDIGSTMTVNPIVTKSYSYLALGDSYTIGQSVPATDNFPNQVALLMQEERISFYQPRIIAKTGWTTNELEAGIVAANTTEPLAPFYDFVTLLIGVNNQYRGRTVESYKPEFEELLKKAIRYADNRADHVIIISIPDWGVTPFANGRDRAQIAREIDAYNAANKQIAALYNIQYLDITPWTREAATDNTLLAGDGLHPSGKEYKRWADRITTYFKTKL